MPITVNAGDPNARAANATQLKYGAQQSQIERALAALSGTRAADEAAINQYGTGGRAAINQTFDQLLQNLATNRELTQSKLNTQVDAVGAGYREANQIGEAARSQAIDRLTKMYGNNRAYAAASLGDAASPLERLAAQLTQENANSDATYTGNLRNFAAQQEAFQRAAEGGAERDRSNRLSGFESELLRAIANAKAQATEEEFDLHGNLLDTITERGSYQNEMAQTFMDQLFGQQMQAAQFNLSEQEAAAQAADRAASRAMQQRAMDYEQSRDALGDSRYQDEQYWKALEFDLRERGMSAEEARDARDFLFQQSNADMDRKWQTAGYLNQASSAALEGGGDPASAVDAARAQLIQLGILPKTPVRAGNPGMSAGVSATTTQRKPQSNSRPGFFSGILG